MSLERPERVDAISVREGVLVLSMHHFGPWDPLDDYLDALLAKLASAQRTLERPGVRLRAHGLPIRLELVCSETPPNAVVALCRQRGVHLLGPREDLQAS